MICGKKDKAEVFHSEKIISSWNILCPCGLTDKAQASGAWNGSSILPRDMSLSSENRPRSTDHGPQSKNKLKIVKFKTGKNNDNSLEVQAGLNLTGLVTCNL